MARKILLILLLLGSAQARAAEPIRLSFGEALRLAKQRHVQVLVAEQRVQQALARIGQARSSLLPQLQAAASQYRRTVNLETFGINVSLPGFNPDVPPFNVFDARITLQQTLFDQVVLKRLASAKTAHWLSRAQREQAEEDALALVANLYIEAVRAQQMLEFVKTLQRRDEARLRNANSRRQLGLGSDLEVLQAKAALARTKNQVASAVANAQERRLDLAAALGLPQDHPLQVSFQDALLKKALPSPEEIREKVSGHPEIKVAQGQLEQSRKDRQMETAAYYPKLTAEADYGLSGPNPVDSIDTYNYGGQLSIPLYQGGLRKARVQEANSKIKESEVQREEVERDQLSQALSALETLKQAQVGLAAAETDAARAGKELALSRDRLTSGLGDALEVTDAQAGWALSQDALSEARATYRLAWVNLKHELGTMRNWPEEWTE